MTLHRAKIITMQALEGQDNIVKIDGWATTGAGPIQAFDLFGEPVAFGAVSLLDPVGSFETPAQMIDLMTPTLVQKAREKLMGEFREHGSPFSVAAISLGKQPYLNACWILKATPEELRSWAETLARRPS